jgi:2-oxoglutarate dehydrogenase complex dehydrogenase (E1) component-like enzyme
MSKQRNQTGVIAQGSRTLRDLIAVLKSAYCGSIGIECSSHP